MMESLVKKLKILLEKNKKDVVDIFLFGSYVKGRLSPKDIDIVVLGNSVDRSVLKKSILAIIVYT